MFIVPRSPDLVTALQMCLSGAQQRRLSTRCTPALPPGPSAPPSLPLPRRGSGAKGAGSRARPGRPCPRSPRSRPAQPRLGAPHLFSRGCPARLEAQDQRDRCQRPAGQRSASSSRARHVWRGRAWRAGQEPHSGCDRRQNSGGVSNEDRQETPASLGANTPKRRAQGQSEEATAVVTPGIHPASPRGAAVPGSARQCPVVSLPSPPARSPHLSSGSALPRCRLCPGSRAPVRMRGGGPGACPGGGSVT